MNKTLLHRYRQMDDFISVVDSAAKGRQSICALRIPSSVHASMGWRYWWNRDVKRRAEGEARYQTYTGLSTQRTDQACTWHSGSWGRQIRHSYLCRSMCYLSCMKSPLYTFDLCNLKERQSRHFHSGNSKKNMKNGSLESFPGVHSII